MTTQDNNNQSIIHWLKNRHTRWERFEQLLNSQKGRRDESENDVLELIHNYESLVRDVALARKTLPGSRISRYLEALLTRGLGTIYRKPKNIWAQLVYFLRIDIPSIVSELRTPIAFSVIIFMTSCLVGWLLVDNYPELATLFASEKMIEYVQRGELWTDGMLNIAPSSLISASIMTNNIVVTFFAFTLGSFYGLGTLYILGVNGLMLGSVFALTGHYGLDFRLLEFIELSVIILASAAGIKLGEALIRPGNQTRTQAFQRAVNKASKLIIVGMPLLVGAGLIEGDISPNHEYSFQFRLAVGLSYWLFMMLLLSGKIGSLSGKNRNLNSNQ